MDAGAIGKAPAVAAPAAAPRADALHSAGAVATELAAEAVVPQAGEADAVRFRPAREVQSRAALDAALQDMVRHNIEIDPHTREVIYQTLDETTGEVVRQTPDEAILRLRAYVRELREASEGCRDSSGHIEKHV